MELYVCVCVCVCRGVCVTKREGDTMCEAADSCGRVQQGRLLSFVSLRN